MKTINILFLKITQFARNLHLLMLKSIISFVQYTRITCSTWTLIDHIIASFSSKVSQKGVINVGLWDHQLMFCTRKNYRFKTGSVRKYINFRSLKSYRVDVYKKNLGQLVFSNYEISTASVLRIQVSLQLLTKTTLSKLNECKKIPKSGLMVISLRKTKL